MDRKLGVIGSSLLRGKLGIDTFIIGFSIFGCALIPTYFYFRDKKRKETMKLLREQYAKNGDLDSMSLDFSTIGKEEFDRYSWEKMVKKGEFS